MRLSAIFGATVQSAQPPAPSGSGGSSSSNSSLNGNALHRTNTATSTTSANGATPPRGETPCRPPTPVGNEDPILLPNEIVLQVFPKKLCSYRSTPKEKTGFFSLNEPEYFHSYLTKKGRIGALWVTTQRLMFVPNQKGIKGCTIDILDLGPMKVIESDMQMWFFLAHVVDEHIFTVPFSTQARTQAFLKLMTNLRFEHKVRQALPPPYRRSSASFYDANGPLPALTAVLTNGSMDHPERANSIEDIMEEGIEDEEEDWEDNERRLPSYEESENAVERYLIDRGLLREDGTPIMPIDSPDPVSTDGTMAGHVELERLNSNVLRRQTTAGSSLTPTTSAASVGVEDTGLRRITTSGSTRSVASSMSAVDMNSNSCVPAEDAGGRSLDAMVSAAQRGEERQTSATA
ncbi:uncharacterized protein V1518DRAFT_405435 [Limtongia smithiae]|uniref:uncharacterized protein n=1 Tax=Limtongia smithiae TaxID=1125753 RepID=UPI0034CE87AA